jgi:ketosteroid isomerase-like protein
MSSPLRSREADMDPALADFIRRYLATIERGASFDELGEFFAPDVVQEEFPNPIVPNGAKRTLEDLRQAAERGRKVVTAQRYEIRSMFAQGNRIAVECLWTGTLSIPYKSIPAGGDMRAYIAMVIDVRDGKIVAQRNYDCYEPF